MQAEEKRDQKGEWIRVAPCLYRYRSSGVYYAVVKRSGKIIRRSLEVSHIEPAKRLLRDFLKDQENTATDAHKTFLDDYMEEFRSGRTGALKTLKRYQKMAELVKTDWPGGSHILLSKVDHNQCSKWLSQWNGKVAQYNHGRQWLLAFFDFAVANRKLSRSPLDKRLLKAMRRPRVIRNAPTLEEFEAILAEVRAQPFTDHSDDSADVLEFMGRAGVGQAETSGLKYEHINLADGTIKLFRVKTQTAFQIPIFPKLRPLLERIKKNNPDTSPVDSVFKLQDPKKALASACKRLKLPSFSQRSLRRMFIINALQKGVAVKTISKWQGHQDGGVLILKTYSEVIDQKANQEAASLLV